MKPAYKKPNAVVLIVAAILAFLLPEILRAQQPTRSDQSVEAWTARIEGHVDEALMTIESSSTVPPVGNQRRSAVPFPLFLFGETSRNRTFNINAMRAILRENGLPARLISVAAVESDFDTSAVSPKGAAGLWQLMPETARRFGLRVTPERDERFDPAKSTIAAADYLKFLYSQFHAWPLALAAYNAGENRVEQIIERGDGADFWTPEVQSRLPQETRSYVRKVLNRMNMPATTAREEALDDQMLATRNPGAGATTSSGGNVVFAVTSADGTGAP